MSEAHASAVERPHVLIVTADEDLKEFLGEGLMLGGLWTSVVASGVQTLEVFRLRTFDLVLIDSAIPGIGSVEIVRRLRGRSDRADSDTPRTDVPILFVAADPKELDPDDALAAGADGILSAPLELEDLVPHLHQIVAAWRAAHPDRPMADALAQQRPSETNTQ